VQPAVGDPDVAGGLDWMIPRSSFQSLLLCDNYHGKGIAQVYGELLSSV